MGHHLQAHMIMILYMLYIIGPAGVDASITLTRDKGIKTTMPLLEEIRHSLCQTSSAQEFGTCRPGTSKKRGLLYMPVVNALWPLAAGLPPHIYI